MNKIKKKTTKMRVNPEDSKKFFWVLLVFVLIIGIWIGVQGANQGMLTLATSAQGLTNQDGAIKVRIRALDASRVNESLYTIDQTAVVKDGQLKLRWQIPGTAKKKAAYIEVCALDKKAGPSAAVKKACIEDAGDVGYNKVSCPYYVPANSTGFSGQLNGWNKLDDSQKVGCSGGRSFSKVSSVKALASAQSPGIEIDGGGVLVAKNGKIETKDVEQFVKDALSGSSDTTVQVTTNVPVPGPQGQAGVNGANGMDGAAGIATVSGGGLILTGTNLSLDDSCAAGELLKWDGSNWGCAVDGGGGSDSQTLSLAANVLAISGGNSVNLSGYLDNTDSQALSWVGGTRTLSLTGGGSVVISDSDTTYSAGNGLSLGGTTFSINSPTCAGTTKLTWNGTAFSCAADVDTDTDTTNFNIAANGGAGQNISSGGTVNFTNGTGTTASRSGSDVSFGLNNTAVTSGAYAPSNNANGSLALPQFTVDAQGRLTAASTTNVTLTGIANSQLANSAVTINTAGPLAGGGAVSLGGSLNLSLDLSDAGDSATATISSGSGLEVSGSEIGLLRGCGNTQLLKWNSGSLRWECAADTDTDTNSGGTVTSITAGTGLSGGVITTSGTIDIANTGVTAASYGSSTSIPVITVNAQGQITAASSSAIPTATTSTTGLLTDTDWDTFNGKENVLTFTGNGLFSRTGNTVTGLACSAGEIPKWTAGTFVCGVDIDTDTTYSAGNGLSLGGTTFSINSPTCAGTTKLTWNGTVFSCAADVDTDTDTTNFNVAAQGTVGSQNIASGDTVTFNNGTGTTATRSGSTVTYGLNNTAVTAASYAPSDNVNGSLALPQFTVDAQGRLTAASTTNVTLTGIANSQLTNSAITVNTSGGLSGGSSVSLGGSVNLTIDLSDAADANTATTSSGSGLEVSGGEIGLIRGCATGELLKYNSTSRLWACATDTDTDTDTGVTSVGAIDSQAKSANGAVISGTILYLQNADASNPGLVSTGTQTFAGDKTFNGNVIADANLTVNGDVVLGNAASDAITFTGEVRGASPLAFEGLTNDGVYTTFAITDPTLARTVTFPDRSGTVSLSGDTFTGDVTGTLNASGATALTIAANSVALGTDTTGDYVTNVTAGGGLTGSATGEGSTPTLAIVSANGGIVVNADDIALTITSSADALSATTSSSSGLEVLASGLTLIQGCSDTQVLAWNETTDVWACSTPTTAVTTVGTIDSQAKSANGAVISGNTLYLQTADGTNVGLVSTGTQTFAGDKTFSGNVIASGSLTANGDVTLGNAATDALTFTGEVRGASPLAFEGATNDGVYTTFAITDPTVARTITFPDASGTVCLQASASCAFISTTLADGQILIGNGSNVATAVTPSGDVTISNTGVTTIGANSVALTTDTTGNYVADVAAGTGISIGGSLGEGWTPTINLANTAVTAASYSAADNANGSIAIPQFTVDAQGRLTAASTANITPTGIANSQLANSSLTITAGAGLTNGGAVSLGGTVALDIGAGNGITVNANDITIDLTAATDGLSATTSSSSGLEVLGTGLTLLQGCSDTQLLKWNETTDVWACGSDTDTGVTSIGAIDSQTKSANGAVISGTSLVLQTADATSPGLVSTGTQTFAGAKTFIDDTTISSQSDSATAFQVQNSSAGLLFNVDAATGTTTIAPGGSGSTTTLQVLNGSGDQLMNVDTTNVVNNLITNSSFEVNDTGWSYSPGYVDATQAYVGKSSLRVDAANTGDGATYDVALASDTSYTLSFYAKAGSENYEAFASMYAGYYDGTSDVDCLTSQTVSASGWTRYSCTFTTGTTSGTPSIYIRQNDSTARAFYIDGVQLLENTLPSSIITGTNSTFESGVGSWSGYSGSGPTQSSAQAHMGTYSGRMITSGGGGENGVSLSVSGLVSPSTTYTMKAYIKADASSTQSTYQLGHTLDSGQVLTSRNGCNVVTPTSSSWKVLTCTFTTASALRGAPYITITQTNNLSTATTTYIDSVSMYAGADIYGTDQGFTMGNISLNGAISSPVLFQNTSNSTTAFQIQGANSSTSLLVADTLNNRVAIGKALASYTLDVEGVINATESVRTPLVTSSAGLTVTGGTTLTLQSTGANAVSLDSGTTGAINIGTGSSAKTVTIGSITGASATAIRAGTGGLTLGSSGVANTIQIGNTTGAVSQTINIGTNSTASSTNNVNIGSTVAGITTINGTAIVTGRTTGSSSTLLVNNSTSTGAVFVAQDNGTAVLTIANNGGATFKTVTNTVNAFKTTNSNNDVLLNVGTTQSISDNTNIINNSSFESGSTGWTGKSGGSLGSGTGGGSVTGVSYMNISMDAVGEGAYYPVTLSANTDYTFSVYARTYWGAMNTLVMGHQDQSGTDIDDCVLSSETIDTNWHRVSCTFTTGATISSSNVYIRQSDVTSRSVDFDAVQLQASPSLSAYNMGEVYFNAPINQNLIITSNAYADTNDLTLQVQDAAGALQFGVSAGGQVTVANGLAVNGGDLTSTATTFNFLSSNVTELNIGDAVGASGIDFAGGSGSTGCTIQGAVGSLTCSGNITSTATSGIQGWWSRTGTTLQPANSGDNITTSGNITTTSTGSITSAGGLQVDGNTILGDAATDTILAKGSMIANGAATGTTDTTSGTGTDTTTVTISGTSFANGDVILIDNAGQDYYTRVTAGGGTSSLTVSPAVTFETGRTVTKYNIQNIGATDSDYTTQSNRFFQGYFLGGVVTGAGSTTLSDGRLHSTVGLNFDAPSYTFTNTSDSTSAFRVNKASGENLIKFDTATTENLLSNGNFEANTTGWAAHGSSTVSQTGSQYYLGSGSMSVATTAAANDGAKFNYALASQTSYTMTFYVKNSVSTSSVSTINIGRSEDGSTDTNCATGQTINGAGWSKITCTFTTGNVTGTDYIYIKQTDAVARTLYVDSVQLQTSTNIVSNPDVEVNTSGWGYYGAPTLSQTSSQFYTGAGSLQVDTSLSASSEGPAQNTFTAQPNTTYTFSAMVMLDAGTGSNKTFSVLKRLDNIDSGSGSSCTSASLVPGTWTRLTCTFTTGSIADSNPFISINVTDDGVTPITFYVDNATFAVTKWNSNDIGRISLNGSIDSPLTVRGAQDSTSAFQVQQQNGTNTLTVDTLNGRVGIGTAAPTKSLEVNGKILFKATNTDTDTFQIQNTATTNNVAFNVAASSRAVTVGASTNTANGSLSVYGTGLVKTMTSGGSASAFSVQDSANANVLTVSTSTGNKLVYVGEGGIDAKFQIVNTSSSAVLDIDTATTGSFIAAFDNFHIQSSSAADMIFADGTNNRVIVGDADDTSSANTALLIVDSASTANLPTGVNGGIVYDSQVNKFKIYEGSAYKTLCNTTDLACAVGDGGVTSIGTIDSQTKSANGAVISGTSLVMQNADATYPGLVSTGTQTFAGDKAFNGGVTIGTVGTPSGQLFVSGSVPSAAAGSVSGGTNPYRLHVQGSYAYVVDEGGNALKIYDITNPASPALVSSVATGTAPYDVYVKGSQAYVINRTSATLQVFDVSNPASPTEIGSVAAQGATPEEVEVYGNYAYVSSPGTSAIEMYDVSDPKNPSFFNYAAYGTSPTSTFVQGKYLYFTDKGSDTLEIYDISNPDVGYFGGIFKGTVSTGALSDPSSIFVQGKYAYITHEGTDTLGIYNITDPTAPTSVGTVSTGTGPKSVYVQGRYAYVANTTGNTLQIIDVSNPASPTSEGTVAASGATSVSIKGRYAYVAQTGSNTLDVYDVGGAYIQQLETGGMKTGSLDVSQALNVDGALTVNGASKITGDLQVQDSNGAAGLLVDTTKREVSLSTGWNGDLIEHIDPTTGFSSGTEPASVVVNGYMYVVGGNSTVQYGKIMADGSTPSVSTTTSLPASKTRLAAVAHNGYMYAIGGGTSNTVYFSRINADGTLGSWKSTTSLTTSGTNHSAAIYKGNLYVVSSGSGNPVIHAKINPDGTVGSWTTSSMTGGTRPQIVVVNSKLYEFSGQSTDTVQYASIGSDGTLSGVTTGTFDLPIAPYKTRPLFMNGYLYAFTDDLTTPQMYYAKVNSDGTIGSWNTSSSALWSSGAGSYNYPISAYNGYVFAGGVNYYTTGRTLVGGTLDLTSLGAQDMNGSAGVGASLNAGNTNIVGSLDVVGQTSLMQGLSVAGDVNVAGQAVFQNTTDSTSAFRVQTSGGNSIVSIDTATTPNLITNQSFELNTDGWAARTSATLTKNTTEKYVGTSSMQVVTGAAANNGVKYNYSLASSTTYSLSFYAKSGGTFTTMQVGRTDNGTTGSETNCLTGQTVSTTNWTRYTCTFTTGTTSGTPYIYIKQSDAAAHTYYVDGVQLEAASASTNFKLGGIAIDGVLTSHLTMQNSVDSTGAFEIQNAAGTTLLGVDTINGKLFSTIADGASAVGLTFNTPSYSTSGAKLVSFQNNGTEKTYIDKDGNIDTTGGIQTDGSSILGDAATDTVTSNGSIIANASATGTTDTTSGTGTNTTTVTIVGTAFANGDVILIDNAGQDYYTRVTAGGGTSSLTVSPAVSFDNAVTVTKYNVQNVGATSTDYTTTTNRFFQGYFLGGVVTGSGSTTLSDGLVSSTGGTLNLYGGGADGASAVGLTVNTPSYSTSGAKLVSFQNNGTEKFSVDKDGNINVVTGAAYKINGSDICTSSGCAVLATSGIQNQSGSDQTGDFRISGTGRANGSLQTPLLDTATATALDIGTTNATGINLNQNTTVAAGKNFNAYGRSTFKSSTGLDNAFQVQSSGNDVLLNVGNAGYNSADTNLITNSNFENSGGVSWSNKNGGSVGGGGTIGAYSGSWWMTSNNTGVDDGTKYDVTLSPSTTYTFSAYVRLPSGSMSTLVLGHQDQSGTDIDCATSPSFADTDGWVRVSCIFTTGGTISNSNVYIKQSDASSRTIYIDAAMLQARGYLSAYTMGDNFFAAPLTRGLIISGANGNQKALDVQSVYGTSLFNVDSSTNVIGAGTTMNFLAPNYAFKNTADSTSALTVQKANGTSVFNVDTSNNRIEYDATLTSTGINTSAVVDGASAKAFTFNTSSNYTTSGAKLVSIQNNGAEKFYVDKDGNVSLAGTTLSGTGALSILSDTSNALTLDSGSSGAINLGTNANAKTITIGNSTGATGLVFDSGTAGLDANSTASSTTAFNFDANSVTTGTALQVNATSLTSGLAFQVVGPSSKNLLRIKNDTTQPLDDQSVIIGEGGISASKPDSLARDQLYVFGRINYSWNMFTQDFLTGNPAVAADGLFMNGYYDENIGTGGTSPSGQIQMQSTAGSSGMARLTFTGTLGTGPWASNWGTGGNLVTERSLNPVFEARVQASSNTDVRHIVGFTDMALNATTSADTNNSANEVFFRKTAAGTNWEAVSRNGSGTEEVTTLATACAGSTACTTTALRTMRIELENVGANGTARFYIDGTLVATHTTTAVPANTNRLGWLLTNTPTTTTYSGRTLDMDYVRVWSDDPPSSIAPGDVGQNDGVEGNTNITENGDTPTPEDNSNEALLGRIKTLEEDVSDLNQYKDVLTTEAIGESSLKKAIFIADVEFRKQVEFSADALFKANVNVDGTLNANGRVVVSNNTGTITIQPGQTEIQVLFAKSLQGKPNVFLSTENPDVKVVAQTRTKDGFVIKLSEPITEPLDVQWFAVEKE